ncbi:MAG: hypothetical protein ACR2QM_03980 [Longimicrobiales bacterium]
MTQRRTWLSTLGALLPLIFVPLLMTPGSGLGQSTPANEQEFGSQPAGRMHALMERTFLKVDVLTLDLCFDSDTSEGLARALDGAENDVRDSVAQTAFNAQEAVGLIEFKRGIELGQFLEGVAEDHERAVAAGLLADSTRNALTEALPEWFSFLEERKILEGDRIHYRFYPDSVRTTFHGVDDLRRERVSVGKERRGSILGAYFAPGASLRDRLIESLWAEESELASSEGRCHLAAGPRHSS